MFHFFSDKKPTGQSRRAFLTKLPVGVVTLASTSGLINGAGQMPSVSPDAYAQRFGQYLNGANDVGALNVYDGNRVKKGVLKGATGEWAGSPHAAHLQANFESAAEFGEFTQGIPVKEQIAFLQTPQVRAAVEANLKKNLLNTVGPNDLLSPAEMEKAVDSSIEVYRECLLTEGSIVSPQIMDDPLGVMRKLVAEREESAARSLAGDLPKMPKRFTRDGNSENPNAFESHGFDGRLRSSLLAVHPTGMSRGVALHLKPPKAMPQSKMPAAIEQRYEQVRAEITERFGEEVRMQALPGHQKIIVMWHGEGEAANYFRTLKNDPMLSRDPMPGFSL